MAEGADGAGIGPPPTVSDGPAPAAVPRAALTRPDAGRAGFVADNLPPPLRERYSIVGELTPGGQSRLYHCRDRDGTEVVVKIIDRNRDEQVDVWRLWRAADPTYVVPLCDTHVQGERCYEVTPYQPAGSLADRDRRRAWPLPSATVEEILRQLTDALAHIHAEPPNLLVHRDLKPANILVQEEDPLRIRLTDFGLALPQQETYVRHSGARTPAYAAPEAVDESSPASDCWSLGMTVLELSQGHHPFEEANGWRSDGEISRIINTQPVPLDADMDPRWQSLFRGLLTRDPRRRWGVAEVRRWLAGESPPVYAEQTVAPRPPLGTPFAFANLVVNNPIELAAAIAGHWSHAGGLVVGRRWQDLRSWASTYSPELGEAIDELDRVYLGSARHPVDRVVAELLIRLDPNARPVFRGWPADPSGLARLATAASGDPPDPTAAEAVTSLLSCGALQALARLPSQEGLASVDDRWRRWSGIAEQAVTEAFGSLDALASSRRLGGLLLAAAAWSDYAAELARQARALNTRRHRRIRWFARLVRAAAQTEGDAPAFQAVMVIAAARLLDPVPPDVVEAARRRRQRTASSLRPAGPDVPTRFGLPHRLRGGGAALGFVIGFIALSAVAAFGVGAATSITQGVLTAVVLVAAAGCLTIGLSRPRGRFTNAMLGIWAGGTAGLPVAALLGSVVGVLLGPVVGWPTFWISWVCAISLLGGLGAVE